MPSKGRQLYYLGLRVLAWLLWLPLTGNPRHGRTWGELKRLTARQTALMLVPLALYATVAAWAYVFFPRDLVPLAAATLGAASALGVTLVGSSLLATRLLELELLVR